MPKLKIQGGELAYHEYGEGAPLILLHGEYLSHSAWRGQINAFANHFYTITYDQRGHGESTITRGRYHVSQFADDLFRMMDALKLERALLCGHSLGALVAQEAALRQPDRIGAMVLAEGFYSPRATWLDSVGSSLNWAASQMLGHDYLLRRLHTTRGSGYNDYIAREIARHTADYDNYLNIRQMMLAADYRAQLEHIRPLTFILVGENSGLIHRQARLMNEKIKGSFYGVVLGAGHMPHWDNPALFNGITLEFLQGAADLTM